MSYKSKRSKATDIPRKVKEAVLKRDGGMCINKCGRPGIPNAHYIRRTQGGLGIEQNVVCLCQKCHQDFDDGFKREEIGNNIKKYLQSIYGDSWNEKDLIYDKWKRYQSCQ